MPAEVIASNCSLDWRSASSKADCVPASAGRLRDELPKAVRTAPDHSTETPTVAPSSSSWKCRVSESATTACSEMPQGPSAPVNAPKIEAVLRTWPTSCSSIKGMNDRIPFTTPQRLTPSTQSQSPREMSHSRSWGPSTPALLHSK